jgi:hypothetical protein
LESWDFGTAKFDWGIKECGICCSIKTNNVPNFVNQNTLVATQPCGQSSTRLKNGLIDL